MDLWRKLYNTVWIIFFACVLVPRWMGVYAGYPIHALLGLALLFVAISNARQLESMSVPARLKRISKAIKGYAIFQLITGLAMGAVHLNKEQLNLFPEMPWVSKILYGIHVAAALATLAKSASVATGYDMFEEKEFQE